MPATDTFPQLLAATLARAASQPLVTFYDDVTGERVELSVTTYANWVAKTAGLLQDELMLERGATLLVDLPTHWLGPVWLGAAWTTGMAVTDAPDQPHDAVVCGPDTLTVHAGRADAVPVVALSLLPMGAAFRDPLPTGVVDYGRVVWGQPDAFLPDEPPEPDDVAWRDAHGSRTQAELLAATGEPAGTRLLTDVNPVSTEGLATVLGPLAAAGGTVWLRHPDPDGWERRAAAEQATRVLRSGGADQPRS